VVFFGNTANPAANHTVSANDPNNPTATMVGHFNVPRQIKAETVE
jgi:hypothetical protein